MLEKHDIEEEDEMFAEDAILPEDTDVELEEEEALLGDKLKSLRKKLAECESEKQKHLDVLQRTRADFLNSKRRLEEQVLRDKERATDKILAELLIVADSFDIAMGDTAQWEALDQKWRGGVEAIHAKLMSILRGNNVVAIDPTGEAFNPQEHEAVSNSHVEDDAQVDTIIAVLQKGYKRNDDIIRPARVIVGTK